MIFCKEILIGGLILVGALAICAAPDVLVQLNVNRPLTDVNEKFVSFAVTPEDLYKVLDGGNRKTLTRMASILGDSYVKFIGDYFFTTNSPLKQRNPAKIIWKGFNRWTRAVNWTMVIPVPYQPRSWDPMETLKILNSSYMLGITDCVWQLGSDFETAAARDYMSELNTFALMLESFKPYVEDWAIMGADISAGSSPEETRKYIEMSKDVNAAYGWAQSSKVTPTNIYSNYIHGSEPALKVLLNQNVPVWLTLPEITKDNMPKDPESEAIAGFRWAQTLGEAAISGFDAIFRHLSVHEMEQPSFSFYVSALFKKVMGSRVFNARPLNLFAGGNKKLYTHCANMVSGGLAFMLVNIEDSVKQISIKSLAKFSASELWQYSLTQKKDKIYLNEERLTLNSSISLVQPQIKKLNSDTQFLLGAPGKSVTFWVLPTIECEHCQFSEIDATEVESDSMCKRQYTYTSADKLIKGLIQEAAMPQGLISKLINRRRRDTIANRSKRFILEDTKERKPLDRVFQQLDLSDSRQVRKREESVNRHASPWDWLTDLLKSSIPPEKSSKRKIRSTNDYFESLFGSKPDEQKTSFTRKITEITKPERKVKSVTHDGAFNEEEFFKKMDDHQEPEYTRFPDGDVHLRHIATPDGEEIEEGKESTSDSVDLKIKKQSLKEKTREIENITKPLTILPSEFYESFSRSPFKSQSLKKHNVGTALNSLLFAQPFSKNEYVSKKNDGKFKLKTEQKNTSDVDFTNDDRDVKNFNKAAVKFAKEFLIAQKKLRKAFLTEIASENEGQLITSTTPSESTQIETTTEYQSSEVKDIFSGDEENLRMLDILTDNLKNYFKEKESDKLRKPKRGEIAQTDLKDIAWWNLASLRKKRAINELQYSKELWRNNEISRDDDPAPLGALHPEKMRIYEYRQIQPQEIIENTTNETSNNMAKTPIGTEDEITSAKLMATLKDRVTGFVGIVARHVQEWYTTLTGSSRKKILA